ncbi:hypothetical protein CEXT_607331 [Caerostris extrusa]|uniref:Uncharacterized protein n=1 Tax=Caerostris extrusa TaxID=172846 RepID=A0AAV4V9R7_CAEEX|nr:hypothetical protein CEXT_607331 [Caerostris extrusa]
MDARTLEHRGKMIQKAILVSAYVTPLKEKLKQEPFCYGRPKDILWDYGSEIELDILVFTNLDFQSVHRQTKIWARLGFEPGTSRTLSEKHTPKPPRHMSSFY